MAEPSNVNRVRPPEQFAYAALGNGRIAAVGVAAGIGAASFASGVASGVTFSGISTDAMLAAACSALVERWAYRMVTFGSL